MVSSGSVSTRSDEVVEVRGALRRELTAFYEVSAVAPLLAFTVSAGVWLALIGIGLWAESTILRLALIVPLALASGQLFVIGHDAAHGSFSASRTVNAVTGRLAFVPSVHVFGLWRRHHNVHHRYTNLRGRDFVWTPLSIDEYEDLPRWHRALHRVYRNRTGLGLGVHYLVEIWAPRMLYPWRGGDRRGRGRLLRDTAVLYASLGALVYAGYRFALAVDPDRAGDRGYLVSTVLLLFVLPLIGTHWLIGFVIFLNHTHPDIVWYDDPEVWARRDVQIECSAGLRLPKSGPMLPRRIMNHTAHHVNTKVPVRRLAPAQRYLVASAGTRVVSYEWSPRRFAEILATCRIYDYDTQEWLGYSGTRTGPGGETQ